MNATTTRPTAPRERGHAAAGPAMSNRQASLNEIEDLMYSAKRLALVLELFCVDHLEKRESPALGGQVILSSEHADSIYFLANRVSEVCGKLDDAWDLQHAWIYAHADDWPNDPMLKAVDRYHAAVERAKAASGRGEDDAASERFVDPAWTELTSATPQTMSGRGAAAALRLVVAEGNVARELGGVVASVIGYVEGRPD